MFKLHIFAFLNNQFMLSPLLLLVSGISGVNSSIFGIIAIVKKVTRLYTILGDHSK